MAHVRSLSFDSLYQSIPHSPDEADDDVEGSQPKTPTLVDFKIRWVHLLLGCTILLPWNVMITAMPYFFERVAGSGIEHTFASYLSISCTTSNFMFLAHATLTSKHASPARRARGAIISIGILTFLLVLSTFFTMPPRLFFLFVLVNAAAQSAAGSYLQTAVIAVASLLGPATVQALMAGQAVIAVAVSGVQVVSAVASTWGKSESSSASDGTAEERSAFFFFTLSTLFVLASAVAHHWLINTSTYKAVAAPLEQHSTKVSHSSTDPTSESLLPRGKSEADDDWRQAVRLAKANVTYEIAVSYVFVVTLAIFPPITASVLPVNPETHPLIFTCIHFLVFNIGDLLGRYNCSFPFFLIWCRKRLLVLSLARTLFIPLFLMCNVQRPSMMHSTPIINSDFMFMFILLLFGWSNGYLSSMCMMSAPSVEHNPNLQGHEDVDVAATVANFSLVGGLVLGSAASFAVKSTVCQCNPFTA
ncbi:hypothetical protein AGABI1DRAFT_113615 [Agaricus bisporus var. burnettii JB137-S8]|uniref:Nucleoside transporter n=1 Tax=Agaricus bisporus var. burnettii (strain JB137-S8 / ATCC MYA-4627 / FGSC 10392) TaxID=597362 RepID=K5WY40_AGABU|nr:uncharacterized protein AGABI1DRAFT_113615 [Agaricus bisporus var. burnettii JB137-S8]EKM80431.1 hypothetical protein AGABI1DRAFT_113615 [Agaricus bisporus var. burnettii JB137-S8]